MKLLTDYGFPLAVIAGLVGLWEVLCRMVRIPVWLLPAPSAIVRDTWTWADRIPGHLWVTFYETVGGFAVSVLVGVPLAIAIVYSPLMRRVLYPILLVVQSVPKVALAPLFLIWIGYGPKSNILIAAIVAFFPMVVNTAAGLESVEPDLLQLTHALQASALRVFWKVRLPWALPHIFSGMKVAMSLAVIGAVVGEFVGSDRGLGYLILTASSNMNTAIVFGVMAVLSALGMVVFWAVCLAERLASERTSCSIWIASETRRMLLTPASRRPCVSYRPVGRPVTGSGTCSLSSRVWGDRPLPCSMASPERRKPPTTFAIECSASGWSRQPRSCGCTSPTPARHASKS